MAFHDLMNELESMAQFAIDSPPDEEIDELTIQRWQALFGYSYSESVQKLQDHRADISWQPVSSIYWNLVRAEKEAQGYDKEAYEHACQTLLLGQARQAPVPPTARSSQPSKATKYLLKMERPLHSIDAIQTAAGHNTNAIPTLLGTDSSGNAATFCLVDASTREAILAWLGSQKSPFQPTFVRYSQAEKALSSYSPFLTLGVDTTLPQHRLTSSSSTPSPAQDEYPVWYFSYGTLADGAVLRRLLDDDIAPVYRPARVLGGELTTWGEKYKALVNAYSKGAAVEGSAFLVRTAAEEDALRCYETDRYEVVRCTMEMLDDGTSVMGLSFHFVGG